MGEIGHQPADWLFSGCPRVTGVDRIIIVGGGLAGFEAVRALRSQEFAGDIVMVTAENEPPYDRPPLSKDVLLGRDPHIHFDMAALGNLDLRLNQAARGLSVGRVETDAGAIEGDGIVIAVGADPIALPGASTLRTNTDARDLYEKLYPGAIVAIIGAGWIGAEVAFAAAEAGCIVTVYEAMSSPLAAALPADLGLITASWYEQAGVELKLGERVDDVAALGADVVVAGLGARPATSWLRGSELELQDRDGAVVVDEFMRTSVPGVVAVGDCAAWWSRRYERRLRVEHWDTALHAPTTAINTLLGVESDPYDPVPYFWSHQFGHNLQFAGHRSEDEQLVVRGDTAAGNWGVGWFRENSAGPQMTAFLTVDRPRDLSQARKAMVANAHFDLDAFSDIETPVKAAVAG